MSFGLSHRTTGDLITASIWNTDLIDILNIIGNQIGLTGLVQTGLRSTFRGLSLRTHPDNDSAGNKVQLSAVDEVVMDDGWHYTSLTVPLNADITASGAAGLDTGSRTASKWYEAHLIGKTSTHAVSDLRLMLHLAKQYRPDQSFVTAPDTSRVLRLSTSTATDKLAQGVTFALAGALEFVDLKFFRNSTATGNMWVTLEADSGGNPSGTPLATSDKVDVAGISTNTGGAVRFVFRTPYTTTAALYHLVLQGDYTRSDTVNIAMTGVIAGGYSGGSAKQYNGTSWSAATGVGDFYFKTYVTLASAALTYPSGYDHGCKLGYVYNSSGNVLIPFMAQNRRVNYLAYSVPGYPAVVTNTLYMDLYDMSAGFIPPCPCHVDFNIASNAASLVAYINSVPHGFHLAKLGNVFNIPSAGAGAPALRTGDFLTEYQGIYALTSADTLYLNVAGYEWIS